MTCIVGLRHGGKTYIGADSAGVAGWSLTTRADSKVFTNGDFVMGFTSSFRMGQLLRYFFVPPIRHPDTDLEKFMVTSFVDAVRGCLKSGGYAERCNEAEKGGEFLVGHAGRLFRIYSDYQVAESTHDFDACGCGAEIACGAMFASKRVAPRERVTKALEAAESFSAGVRGPFNIVAI